MSFILNLFSKFKDELTYLFFFCNQRALFINIQKLINVSSVLSVKLVRKSELTAVITPQFSDSNTREAGASYKSTFKFQYYILNLFLGPQEFFFWKWISKLTSTFRTLYHLVLPNLFSFSNFYIKGFVFLLFIDACLTDDEPLWEPIEWSLVQTWILFIFIFAWIAENLIVSRYGSYTGRDKRVWLAWYKTFWMIEGFYVLNYGAVCLCVIVPYYYETNYNLSFVYSWWHWYSRVFFFKFISFFTIALLMANFLQIGLKWLSWQKGFIVALFISFIYSYLLYTQFFITFFSYFTDPVWYQKTRPIDFIQMSHEPSRWGWGPAKKDHFTYHTVKTVFWFKNDGPFAASFLLFQMYFFASIFFAYFYWISLLRRIYSTQEIPATLTTYCTSSLKQFFYFFLFMYFFIFTSYLANYARLPLEFNYFLDEASWLINFSYILQDYIAFLLSIF